MKGFYLKSYTANTDSINAKEIKLVIKLLNSCFDVSKAKFKIPGVLEKDDLNYTFKRILTDNWDDEFQVTKMISFSSKNIYGGFEIHAEYSSFQITMNNCDSHDVEKISLNLISLLDLDLLFCYENKIGSSSFDVSYGAHDKGIGIKAGLRDVYWVNYYGKAFAELIGKEKLLNLPVNEAITVGEGVYFKLTNMPKDAPSLKDVVKAQIGEEYFVPRDVEGQEHLHNTKERSGLFGLLGHLLHLNRTPENLLVAKLRPDFKRININIEDRHF